jgi:hypothetical protein
MPTGRGLNVEEEHGSLYEVDTKFYSPDQKKPGE